MTLCRKVLNSWWKHRNHLANMILFCALMSPIPNYLRFNNFDASSHLIRWELVLSLTPSHKEFLMSYSKLLLIALRSLNREIKYIDWYATQVRFNKFHFSRKKLFFLEESPFWIVLLHARMQKSWYIGNIAVIYIPNYSIDWDMGG